VTKQTATLSGQCGLFGTADVPDAPTRKHRVLSAIEPTYALPALVYRYDFNSMFPRALPPSEVSHLSADGAVEACQPVLTIDVETSGYPLGHPDYMLKTIQVGNAHRALVFDAECADCLDIVREAIQRAQYLVAYSATADLVPLVHAGLISYDDAWGKMYDVMLATKLTDPNAVGTDVGLKQTAAQVLGARAVSPQALDGRKALFAAGGWLTNVDLDTPPARNGWLQANPRWQRMITYAAADVLDTAALAEPGVLPRVPRAVIDRERGLQHMVARISHDGLPLAPERVAALLGEHARCAETAAADCAAHGLSEPGSGKVVVAMLESAGIALPTTDAGNPSVTAAVLTELANSSHELAPLGAALLSYRQHTTLVSTFLRPYELICREGDGRVRPTIYTLTARTGRTSSVRPNLQNVPRLGGIRGCITADPGYLLVSADLASIELRGAAALSGDSVLTHAVVHGSSANRDDIHWLVAKQVFGPNATKTHRYTVKPGVYGYLYGGGVDKLAIEMGCSTAIAQAVVDGLTDLTPQYVSWANRLKRGRNRYMLYTGMVLQLPAAFPHKWPNYVIQRTARELLVDAMLRWRQTPWGKAIILPIHDELVVMVPEADAVAATEALVQCMTGEINGLPVIASPNEPSFEWQDAA